MNMNAKTAQTVREATEGLTGRREKDILFLRGQIEKYESDAAAADTLRKILRALAGDRMQQAAA